jgi:hypothetical protein
MGDRFLGPFKTSWQLMEVVWIAVIPASYVCSAEYSQVALLFLGLVISSVLSNLPIWLHAEDDYSSAKRIVINLLSLFGQIGTIFIFAIVVSQSSYTSFFWPYFLFLVLLTVLSMILHLFEPRKSNHTKITESIPAEGT